MCRWWGGPVSPHKEEISGLNPKRNHLSAATKKKTEWCIIDATRKTKKKVMLKMIKMSCGFNGEMPPHKQKRKKKKG